jgi:hypothetical protein
MKESKIESDSKKEAAKLGWMGIKLLPFLMKGLPDTMYIGHGKVVFIEYKTKTGRLSPMQIRMHDKFRDKGIEVYVCRSVEETLEVLNAQA